MVGHRHLLHTCPGWSTIGEPMRGASHRRSWPAEEETPPIPPARASPRPWSLVLRHPPVWNNAPRGSPRRGAFPESAVSRARSGGRRTFERPSARRGATCPDRVAALRIAVPGASVRAVIAPSVATATRWFPPGRGVRHQRDVKSGNRPSALSRSSPPAASGRQSRPWRPSAARSSASPSPPFLPRKLFWARHLTKRFDSLGGALKRGEKCGRGTWRSKKIPGAGARGLPRGTRRRLTTNLAPFAIGRPERPTARLPRKPSRCPSSTFLDFSRADRR